MSFWNVNDGGDSIKNTTGMADKGGGAFELIPNNTTLLAIPDEASWDEYEGEKTIKIRWSALAPQEYKNRKIFQTLKVNDENLKRQRKDKEMLAAMLKNAGSDLLNSDSDPTSVELSVALVNVPMMIIVMQFIDTTKTKADGSAFEMNWVRAVAPKSALSKSRPTGQQNAVDNSYDDDLPF